MSSSKLAVIGLKSCPEHNQRELEVNNGPSLLLSRACEWLDAGDHQYKFVADGVWLSDPSSGNQVLNPFGTFNSIVRVE